MSDLSSKIKSPFINPPTHHLCLCFSSYTVKMRGDTNLNQVEHREKLSISGENARTKRMKLDDTEIKPDSFDSLPDDLVLSILCKLSSGAECPTDLINVMITCKRMNSLGLNSMVLSKASKKAVTLKAKNWSENAHRFLKLCSYSGNIEASYVLGMIRFYCFKNRASGASLMAKAAMNSHADSLYSLAVIQFNGSGGSKNDKHLRAGVALTARAAFLGHIDALRELGHCLQDGYGIRRNIAEGRRFLVQANARELSGMSTYQNFNMWPPCRTLLSDFGCDVPRMEMHPANMFLRDWFELHGEELSGGMRMCSHEGCGRPETRNHEFRRCSVCGAASYCSRACQALDWKLRHKAACVPADQLNGGGDDDGVEQS